MSASPTAISEQILSEPLNKLLSEWETAAQNISEPKKLEKNIIDSIIQAFSAKGQGVFHELSGILSYPNDLDVESKRLKLFTDFLIAYADKDTKPAKLERNRVQLKRLFDDTDFQALGYDEKDVPEWKGADVATKAKNKKVTASTGLTTLQLQLDTLRKELEEMTLERDKLKNMLNITSLIGTAAGRWKSTQELLTDLKPLLEYLNTPEGREFTPASAIVGALKNSKKHAEELKILEGQVNDLRSQVQAANQRTSDIELKLNTLQGAHDKLKGDHSTLTDTHKQVMALSISSTTASELQDVKDQLSKMTKERNDALDEVLRLNGLLTTANADVTRLNGLLTTANADVTRLTNELATANGSLATEQAEVLRLNGLLTTANGNLATEQAEVLRLTNDLAAANAAGIPTTEAAAQALADNLGAVAANNMPVADYVDQRNQALVLGHPTYQTAAADRARALADLDAARLNTIIAQQALDAERAANQQTQQALLTQYQQQQQQMQTQQQQLVNNGAYRIARGNNL